MNRYNNFFLSERFRNLTSCVALLLLWVFFLRHTFSYSRSFGIFQDNEYFIGTVLSSMSHSFANGEWPLRMNTILGGVPLYDFSQLSPFYPLYLSFLSVFNNPIDAARSLHLLILAHVLIFEINVFVLIRTIGVSRVASIAGAALVAFGANSFNYANWINVTAPYAWLPLYIAGLIGVLEKPGSTSSLCMALAGAVLLCLASPAQPLIHMIFITGILCFAKFVECVKRGVYDDLRRSALRLILICIITLLLTAPVVLPMVLDFSKMIRWIGPFPAVIGNQAIPFEAFQIGQMSIGELGGVFFKFKSLAVGSQYAGVFGIGLAAVAVISRQRSWVVISFAFIAVYALVSATGSNLGLAYINYHLPLLNKIREPSRFLYLFQLSVGVLAAIGIDEVSSNVFLDKHKVKKNQMLVLMLVGIIAAIVGTTLSDPTAGRPLSYVPIMMLFFLTGLTWLYLKFKFNLSEYILPCMWSCTALFFLAVNMPWYPSNIADSDYASSNGLALDLAIEKINLMDPDHEYRVVFEGNIDKQRAAMLSSYKGVRTFNSYFNPAPYQQFYDIYYHGVSKGNYFRVLGAKYLICDTCSHAATHGYKLVEEVAGYSIYATSDVLPHSYISSHASGIYGNLAEFSERVAEVDLQQPTLFVEPDLAKQMNSTSVSLEACLKQENIRSSIHYRYFMQCDSEMMIVLNEYHDYAWKGFVDGVRKPVFKVNGNQMGVIVPKGAHLVDFRYLPGVFFRSLLAGLCGIVLAIGALVYLGAKRSSRAQ